MNSSANFSTKKDALGIASVVLGGDKELLAKFAGLRANIQRRIVRPALAKGLKPIAASARRNVPVRTGLLKKAISSFVGKKGTFGKVYINPKVGKGGNAMVYDWPAKYAHLVEFGTSHSKPQPFMRPALSQNRSYSFAIMADSIREGVEKYVNGRGK